MSKETGGPAFPRTLNNNEYGDAPEGMSLRDYFAAAAMQGGVASLSDNFRFFKEEDRINYAQQFWQMADAMLAERNK